ncbi:MAG: RNA 3'-terminal phosphate cyclase [Promethearchaeati archaeon SRVP18_Atabeyarchaeia-1]
MIEIDGSLLEGGGQILRTSVAMSALTGDPVKVTRIRAKRENPGLQAQHISAVDAIARLVDAKVEGLQRGSQSIEFHPKQIRGDHFKIDVGTAGSVSLILQALAPVACFAPSGVSLELTGGTDVPFSPSFDFIELVFIPIIRRMGCQITTQLVKRGHYPRGGGTVKVTIAPVPDRLASIRLDEFGEVDSIKGVSHAVKLPRHVATRQADAAREKLISNGYRNVEIEVWHMDDQISHLGPGSGIALCASTTSNARIGADCLGEKGKPAEEVGIEAATKLIGLLDRRCAVDLNLSDMMIPYIALASGKSTMLASDLSLHTKTNMAIVKEFVNTEFTISQVNSNRIISCNGVGFKRNR